MPPFLPNPRNTSTSEGCKCHLRESDRDIVRKPWIKPTEKRPSKLICFDGKYKQRWSPKPKGHIEDRRILCFYHAELFPLDWGVVEVDIEHFTDVEELQLQFGCCFDPKIDLRPIFDHFLKLTNVKSLALDTTWGYRLSFPKVLNFIRSLPNLEDLRIGDIVDPYIRWDREEIVSLEPPSMRWLTGTFVSEGNAEHFISPLSELNTLCRFREIVQRRDPHSTIDNGMNRLVWACSETLESIRIHGRKS